MRFPIIKALLVVTVIVGSLGYSLPMAYAVALTLESGINGNTYFVEGEPGTAGTKGVDYDIGTYLAGGNGGKGHGFKNAYSFHGGHFCTVAEPDCFVSPEPAFTDAGGLEGPDNNWLQGTSRPIAVDLGEGNAADQAIVFNSIDHLGVETIYNDPEKDFWNGFVEGIEFTVYGTNDAADAAACANSNGRELTAGGTSETGVVPGAGVCSTLEQGTLDYVFIDGWADFGAANEGDDYASVWQFSGPMRYVLVVSDSSDPIVGDGFRSDDNELDAIGRFLRPVGEPCPECPVVGGEVLGIDLSAIMMAGIMTNASWILPLMGLAGAAIALGIRRITKQ